MHRAAFATRAAQAEQGQVLLQRHDCYLCHADRETKTGPAHVDVAVEYGGDLNAASTLTAAVKEGVLPRRSGRVRTPPGSTRCGILCPSWP